MKLAGRSGQMLRLSVLVAGMFGFGYALVPLYDVICDVTGLNGQNRGISLQSEVTEAPDTGRLVTVQFVTTVNNNLDWAFGSTQPSIQVHPGRLYTVNFYAENRSGRDYVAQATPSVYPWEAARHVRKTECFCFSQQPLPAGVRKDMPMRFMLDPALPDEVTTVTLSYTMFDATGLAQASQN